MRTAARAPCLILLLWAAACPAQVTTIIEQDTASWPRDGSPASAATVGIGTSSSGRVLGEGWLHHSGAAADLWPGASPGATYITLPENHARSRVQIVDNTRAGNGWPADFRFFGYRAWIRARRTASTLGTGPLNAGGHFVDAIGITSANTDHFADAELWNNESNHGVSAILLKFTSGFNHTNLAGAGPGYSSIMEFGKWYQLSIACRAANTAGGGYYGLYLNGVLVAKCSGTDAFGLSSDAPGDVQGGLNKFNQPMGLGFQTLSGFEWDVGAFSAFTAPQFPTAGVDLARCGLLPLHASEGPGLTARENLVPSNAAQQKAWPVDMVETSAPSITLPGAFWTPDAVLACDPYSVGANNPLRSRLRLTGGAGSIARVRSDEPIGALPFNSDGVATILCRQFFCPGADGAWQFTMFDTDDAPTVRFRASGGQLVETISGAAVCAINHQHRYQLAIHLSSAGDVFATAHDVSIAYTSGAPVVWSGRVRGWNPGPIGRAEFELTQGSTGNVETDGIDVCSRLDIALGDSYIDALILSADGEASHGYPVGGAPGAGMHYLNLFGAAFNGGASIFGIPGGATCGWGPQHPFIPYMGMSLAASGGRVTDSASIIAPSLGGVRGSRIWIACWAVNGAGGAPMSSIADEADAYAMAQQQIAGVRAHAEAALAGMNQIVIVTAPTPMRSSPDGAYITGAQRLYCDLCAAGARQAALDLGRANPAHVFIADLAADIEPLSDRVFSLAEGLHPSTPDGENFMIARTRAVLRDAGVLAFVLTVSNPMPCRGGDATVQLTAAGGPFAYQWQWRPSVPPDRAWSDVVARENSADGVRAFFALSGTDDSLTLSQIAAPPWAGSDEFRCILTDSAGPHESNAAALAVCITDVDDGSGLGVCDGGVTIEDLLFYLAIYADGSINADVDDGSGAGVEDGGVTIDDLLYYLVRFVAGC